MKTNYSRLRFHIIGARTQKSFVFSFIERQTQKTFLRFVKKLLKKYTRLVLFVDNAPWHKGKTIQEFLKKRKKTLRIEYFPTYSPELNIVEQHWKLSKTAIGNRVLKTIPTTKYHLRKILSKKERMPKMFQYLCN